MLVTMDLLPSDGRLEHLLCALMFLKLCTGQETLLFIVDPVHFASGHGILLTLLRNWTGLWQVLHPWMLLLALV